MFALHMDFSLEILECKTKGNKDHETIIHNIWVPTNISGHYLLVFLDHSDLLLTDSAGSHHLLCFLIGGNPALGISHTSLPILLLLLLL